MRGKDTNGFKREEKERGKGRLGGERGKRLKVRDSKRGKGTEEGNYRPSVKFTPRALEEKTRKRIHGDAEKEGEQRKARER